jgi:membrane-associated protease RseP (regulator of RpoE activity)
MSSNGPLWSPGSKIELREQDFEPEPQPVWRPSTEAYFLTVGLFLLTCVTTFFSGIEIAGPPPKDYTWDVIWNGLSYSGPLMLILLCHEMGHYLQSVKHRVPATLPFFIPTPPGFGLFGTMGAVIVQAGGIANRRSLFDIAVSGPLAGIVIALPVAWYGVQQSEVRVFENHAASIRFGDPLILKGMVYLKHGPLAENEDVVINPLLFAGWVGIFLTGLNLMPIGQLDGGHVLYTLLGKRAHMVALMAWLGIIAYMILAQYWGFVVIVGLLGLMGLRHPPTSNDAMPLGTTRTIIGWLTMALLFVCFTPQPIQFHMGEAPPAAVEQQE